MNINNRLKKLENKVNNSDSCQCAANTIATSITAFTAPERCASCLGVIKPSALVVEDFSKVENFNFPVKIYAGFNPDLM